jgi:hypothetical protein
VHFGSRATVLDNNGAGTISVPPSRLVGLLARALNGSFGGTVRWSDDRFPGLTGNAVVNLEDDEQFLDGPVSLSGTPGDTVVMWIRF